ncbi:hypothetical protein BC332_12368 [Capsicum chinense]|nr:hypothetical protein BC332_12368 [Capsicum chinense]
MPIGVITVAVTATAAVLAVQVHLLVIAIRRLQELEMANLTLQVSLQGFKRSRTGISESFSQGGAVVNPSTSDYASREVNSSAITGGNDQTGLQWGWDDDDRDVGMDIQALLPEFGDFGDFFENDALPFGEVVILSLDGNELISPFIFEASRNCMSLRLLCFLPQIVWMLVAARPSMMDVQDQLLLPVGFSSFESFNQPPPPSILDDSLSKHQEVIKSAAVDNQVNSTSASIAGEFDHLIKAEALMSFAPKYGAVETPTGELPFDFQESLCYEVPGSGDCTTRHDTGSILQSKKHYTHIESGKEKNNDKLSGYVRSCATRETQVALSPFSAFNSTNSVKGMSRFSGSSSRNHSQGEAVVSGDNLSSKSEMKKKEIIPVRIAGDIDGGLLDGTLNAPVGV